MIPDYCTKSPLYVTKYEENPSSYHTSMCKNRQGCMAFSAFICHEKIFFQIRSIGRQKMESTKLNILNHGVDCSNLFKIIAINTRPQMSLIISCLI